MEMFKAKDAWVIRNEVKALADIDAEIKLIEGLVKDYNELRKVYLTLAKAVNAVEGYDNC